MIAPIAKPAKNFQNYTENNFTPYILRNTGACEKNWCCMGRAFSWQPKKHSWKRTLCLRRRVSPSAIIPEKKEEAITPCSWAWSFRLDEKKREMFKILVNPIVGRAETAQQHSILSSPSKSDEEGWWRKDNISFSTGAEDWKLFRRLRLHLAANFACSVPSSVDSEFGRSALTEAKTAGCHSMGMARGQTFESCFTRACEIACRT